MTLPDSTRDGLIRVVDTRENVRGDTIVTLAEMIGEHGYLSRRLSAARHLAIKASGHPARGTYVSTSIHWHNGQEFVGITVCR